MELGFAESVRRRWTVLGISVGGKGKEKSEESSMDVDAPVVDVDVDAQAAADEARREILEGAIVKSVLSNAAEGAETTQHSVHMVH
jgi:U3 small nucleolar RNA-associated protein 6